MNKVKKQINIIGVKPGLRSFKMSLSLQMTNSKRLSTNGLMVRVPPLNKVGWRLEACLGIVVIWLLVIILMAVAPISGSFMLLL